MKVNKFLKYIFLILITLVAGIIIYFAFLYLYFYLFITPNGYKKYNGIYENKGMKIKFHYDAGKYDVLNEEKPGILWLGEWIPASTWTYYTVVISNKTDLFPNPQTLPKCNKLEDERPCLQGNIESVLLGEQEALKYCIKVYAGNYEIHPSGASTYCELQTDDLVVSQKVISVAGDTNFDFINTFIANFERI